MEHWLIRSGSERIFRSLTPTTKSDSFAHQVEIDKSFEESKERIENGLNEKEDEEVLFGMDRICKSIDKRG